MSRFVKSKFSKGVVLSFMVICLWPNRFSAVDARGVTPTLKMKVNTQSPAFSALEEVRVGSRSFSDEEVFADLDSRVEGSILVAGLEKFEFEIIEQKAIRLAPEESTPKPVTLLEVKTPVISKGSHKTAAVYRRLRPLRVSRASTKAVFEISEPKVKTIDSIEVAALSAPSPEVSQENRLEAALLSGDLQSPLSLEERRERLLAALSPGDIRGPSLGERIQNLLPSGISPGPRAQPQPKEINPGWVFHELSSQRDQPHLLKGNLELSGGLGFSGIRNRLTLVWMNKGEIKSSGTIWPSRGEFEIFVNRLEGYLFAELLNERGEVLGEAELDLYDLPTPARNKDSITQLLLKLKPKDHRSFISVISSDSYRQVKIPVKEPSLYFVSETLEVIKKEGHRFELVDLEKGSMVQAFARSPKHWPSFFFHQQGQKTEVPLLSEKRVQSLVGLIFGKDEYFKQKDLGIVWGRVERSGQSVSGGVVELAEPGDSQVIYFNQYFLPDPKLKETGQNGLFAILKAKPGLNLLRAEVGGVRLPAQPLRLFAGTVTQARFHAESFHSSAIHLTDSRGTDLVETQKLTLLGTDRQLSLSGRENIQMMKGADQLVLETEGSPEFEAMRLVEVRDTKNLRMPHLKVEEVTQFFEKIQKNRSKKYGLIFGEPVPFEFEIDIETRPNEPAEMKVIYVDPGGQPRAQGVGQAGDSFYIINVQSGLHQVQIYPVGHKESLTRQVLVDTTAIAVVLSQ